MHKKCCVHDETENQIFFQNFSYQKIDVHDELYCAKFNFKICAKNTSNDKSNKSFDDK